VLSWHLFNTIGPVSAVRDWRLSFKTTTVHSLFNTDQEAQFIGRSMIAALKDHDTQISMNGTGCYRDNIFE